MHNKIRGVLEGDPLSPKLFNYVLKEIFRMIKWDTEGIKVNGSYLREQRFGDDVVLITSSAAESKTIMNESPRAAG